MALVTYAVVKNHLRLSDDNSKADLLLKMEVATHMVLAYIGRTADESPAWDDSTDPAEDADFAIVQAAILKVLTNLWWERGADQTRREPMDADVRSMLLLVKDHILS